MQVGTILAELARETPGRPFITADGADVTRADLNARANRLARAYRARGAAPGTRVVVALGNTVEFFAATHAVWKLGAVPVPISPRLSERERVQLLALIEPVLVVGGPPAAGGAAWLPAGFDPDPGITGGDLDAPPPSDCWKIATSGGSTGLPKLIIPAQTSELDVAAVAALRMHPAQRHLVVGPLYHASPFNWSMFGSFIGQHLFVMERFDAARALEIISVQQIQWVCLVPTMMHRMLRLIEESPGRYDLSSLQVVWHMAAPCPPWLKLRWIELIGADRLFELYGTTEGLALTAITGREWLERRGSVGRPVQGEIKVMTDDGQAAAPGAIGEVWMRRAGPGRTYRYIGAQPAVRDGWQTHGDRGWMDDDGYLYLSDRTSDMVLVGGVNVYPAETEAAILLHPGVLSCAVVGLPDEEMGQRLHAVVQAERPVDGAELMEFLRTQLLPVKVPRSVRFVTEALRDDAGKVRRSQVREEELARIARATPASAG